MTDSRLAELLRTLVDGWCTRRALRPLAVLLPSYLAWNGLSDGWHELWRALNDLRGVGPEVLTDEERTAVAEARSLIYQAFKAVGRTAELDGTGV